MWLWEANKINFSKVQERTGNIQTWTVDDWRIGSCRSLRECRFTSTSAPVKQLWDWMSSWQTRHTGNAFVYVQGDLQVCHTSKESGAKWVSNQWFNLQQSELINHLRLRFMFMDFYGCMIWGKLSICEIGDQYSDDDMQYMNKWQYKKPINASFPTSCNIAF